MPEITEVEEPNFGSPLNRSTILDFHEWISRHNLDNGCYGYITQGNEAPRQHNEIIYLEDIDLAPEMSLEEAAKRTRRFVEELPDDIIDADLGTGL